MKSGKISRNVFVLGLVSFFTDLASEMLYPVMPLFVTGVLGASPAILGLIDGVAEGISSGLRWLTGALSDRYRRRKPFVVIGYTISAISKPLMGLSAFLLGWPLFFVGRCLDRLGKSIRTSARDALIADSTPVEHRGVAFGFHRSFDTLGAVLGPLAALVIMLWKPDFKLQWLFVIALGPGLVSALLALIWVKDITHEPSTKGPPAIIQPFPRPFWILLLANALFSLGNSSDSFLILRSSGLGLSFVRIILVFAAYNVVYALAAWPLGSLSDRIGRKPVMIVGWLVYAGVYLGFGFARSAWLPWLLFPLYGMYQAMTEGISKAMITDIVGKDRRAGAIGLFATVSGFGQLAGSLLAGVLWKTYWINGKLMASFGIGAGFVLLAVGVLMLVGTSSPRADMSGHGAEE